MNKPSAFLPGHTLPRKSQREKPSSREGTGNLQVILRSPRQLNVIWLIKVTFPRRSIGKSSDANLAHQTFVSKESFVPCNVERRVIKRRTIRLLSTFEWLPRH